MIAESTPKKGQALPKNIDTVFKWYDKNNFNDPAMQPVLYD